MGDALTDNTPNINFKNTAVAFADKSDKELLRAAQLFKLMGQKWLVDIGSKIGVAALNWKLPFAEQVVEKTIFQQFCGGTTLLDTQQVIQRLYKQRVYSILDYGLEAKTDELEFNGMMNETTRAIEYANQQTGIPAVSVKITGIARFELLQKIQEGSALTEEEKEEYRNVNKRLDAICHTAQKQQVSVFIDAEESWIQETIDYLANKMMARYNQDRAVVYNSFQMYRHDRLSFLIESYEQARKSGYVLGAKLVRGAYMEKERHRAKVHNYPSPIQPNKEATDNDFNTAVAFCIENYKYLASCNASHNEESCSKQAQLILQNGIQRNHAHLNFCQLYGMSDHLTFNLAAAGFNVAKYVVYGPVKEVIPYLIRRAEENTAVSGEVGREYALIQRELKRRGLK